MIKRDLKSLRRRIGSKRDIFFRTANVTGLATPAEGRHRTNNTNKKMWKLISVRHLLQCCQSKVSLPFLQISVPGTGATPLATVHTASSPPGYGHSSTCTSAPRHQNKDPRALPRRPPFKSPPAQRASFHR